MTDRAHYAGLAERLQPRTDALIDGRWVTAAERFETVNPATGQVLAAVARCREPDVDQAVRAARAAFEDGRWRDLHPRERKARLLALTGLIEAHSEELALLETLDVGKPITDSLTVDLPLTVRCFAWYAEAIDKLYDEVAPTGANIVAMVRREPVGVVAVVVPWNYPLMMAAWKLAPALAAGNSVVLKPAEQSPLSALRLGELALEAGLPPGVLNVVPGYGEEAGRALGLHDDVDAAGFTGSTEVGKLFLRYAGESNMKRVSLECGGKAPHLVLPDCPDLDGAAAAAAEGVFYNQGESCTAASRLLVHESIRDDFVARVVDKGAAYQPGDPLDPATRMGALVDATQFARVLRYIETGRQAGASCVLGGQRALEETGGYFVEPTVLDPVKPTDTVAQEEIFGPVLSVIGFRDLDEAVAIANGTIYGLNGAVWTRDITVALTLARRIRAGTVAINTYDDGDITVPFGGYKQSGFGRDRSLHAFDKYTELKTVWIAL